MLNKDEYCPLVLVKEKLDDGSCMDINLERCGFMKPDFLRTTMKSHGLTLQEVNQTCSRCLRMPLDDETSQ